MADSDQKAEGPQPDGAGETSLDRARHWTAFYQELIGYEERSRESMRELSVDISAGEMEAVRKTNLEPREELLDDFRRRLAPRRQRRATGEADRLAGPAR